MPNIKAKFISDGNSTAYFMDTISVEDNKVRIYSSLDETFYSEADLPAANDAVTEPVQKVYNVDEYIEDYNVDNTLNINIILSAISNDGGGVLRFGAGTYIVSQLVLPPKVMVEGCGIGTTIIKRNPNADVRNNNTDSIRGNTGFIIIPASSSGCSIRNLSIYGSSDYTANGNNPMNVLYSDTVKQNGIMIQDATINSLNSDGAPADAYDAITGGNVTNYGSDNRTQKFATIDNISIVGMNGAGIYIGTNISDVSINEVFISHCRYDGIINLGNGNAVSNAHLYANGLCGIYDGGNGSKYANIEIGSTGRYAHTDAAGVKLVDTVSAMLTNIRVKNAYCKGYYVSGSYNTLAGCISDACGAASSKDESISGDSPNPKDVPHVVLAGDHHNINMQIMNSRRATVKPIASYSLLTETAKNITNCIINVIADSDNCAENDSLINEVAINAITNGTTITGDNIITYIP